MYTNIYKLVKIKVKLKVGIKHAAATLCAVVTLFFTEPAESLSLISCGTSSDHYVEVIKYDKHMVKKGDTLRKIASEAYGDPARFQELAKYNKIPNPNLIHPGQVVKVPKEKNYKFLGRLYNITGKGSCPTTSDIGYQYIGAFYHREGTTEEDIQFQSQRY